MAMRLRNVMDLSTRVYVQNGSLTMMTERLQSAITNAAKLSPEAQDRLATQIEGAKGSLVRFPLPRGVYPV